MDVVSLLEIYTVIKYKRENTLLRVVRKNLTDKGWIPWKRGLSIKRRIIGIIVGLWRACSTVKGPVDVSAAVTTIDIRLALAASDNSFVSTDVTPLLESYKFFIRHGKDRIGERGID